MPIPVGIVGQLAYGLMRGAIDGAAANPQKIATIIQAMGQGWRAANENTAVVSKQLPEDQDVIDARDKAIADGSLPPA